MSVDLRDQLREYASAVVAESAPVAWQERDVPVRAWPRRAVALAAVGVATLVVAVVLVTRPVSSGAPVIEQPPTVVPSETASPTESVPPTEDELLLGAVLEAADLLRTSVREFDAQPGWTARQLWSLAEMDPQQLGASASDLAGLRGVLVATVNAELGDAEPVEDDTISPASRDEPGVDGEDAAFREPDGPFSLLAFTDAGSASRVLAFATGGSPSLTDPADWIDSEADRTDYSDPAAVRATALGDEATYYLDGSRGVGTHLLIRHGRFVFEVSHAHVHDVDRVAAAVFAALDSPEVPRIAVARPQVPALRGGDMRYTQVEVVGDRGELGGDWIYEAPAANATGNDDFAWCHAQEDELSILADGVVFEGAGAGPDGPAAEDVVAADDPRYLAALAQCQALPLAVADLGLDLVGVDGAPGARAIGGSFVATRWRYFLDDGALRPTDLVGPDATVVTGWVAVDGSRTWLLRLHVDYRAPAAWVAERFALDLADVSDPDGEVAVRIDYIAEDVADDGDA